jgi:hypothetical protein
MPFSLHTKFAAFTHLHQGQFLYVTANMGGSLEPECCIVQNKRTVFFKTNINIYKKQGIRLTSSHRKGVKALDAGRRHCK